jgi:hypothetical protein
VSDGEISLYFGLKEGRKADLEIVAQAALHWVGAIRAAAQAIDPGAQIRVDLIDASEASLHLNSVFEWIEGQLARLDAGASNYPRLKRLAVALAIFVASSGPQTYDFYFGRHEMQLSAEDRQRLDTLIELMKRIPEVKENERKFFKTLERDPAISEVGVTEGRDPKAKPAITVPHSQFAERGGLWALQTDMEQERVLYPVLDVTLVKPALATGHRSWVFAQEGLPEFSAIMKDQRFLDALKDSNIHEQLRMGIPMTIRLEVKERTVAGVWKVKPRGRSVIEVLSPKID